MTTILPGRALLLAAAFLLAATAALHASGANTIEAWAPAAQPWQRSSLRLVWLTDSLSWAVTAAAWTMAALRPATAWRAAGALMTIIPAVTAAGILAIDPLFFGGHILLVASIVAFAALRVPDLKDSAPASEAPADPAPIDAR